MADERKDGTSSPVNRNVKSRAKNDDEFEEQINPATEEIEDKSDLASEEDRIRTNLDKYRDEMAEDAPAPGTKEDRQ